MSTQNQPAISNEHEAALRNFLFGSPQGLGNPNVRLALGAAVARQFEWRGYDLSGVRQLIEDAWHLLHIRKDESYSFNLAQVVAGYPSLALLYELCDLCARETLRSLAYEAVQAVGAAFYSL